MELFKNHDTYKVKYCARDKTTYKKNISRPEEKYAYKKRKKIRL